MVKMHQYLFPNSRSPNPDLLLDSIADSLRVTQRIVPTLPEDVHKDMLAMRACLEIPMGSADARGNGPDDLQKGYIGTLATHMSGDSEADFHPSPHGGGDSFKLLPINLRGMASSSSKEPRPHSRTTRRCGKTQRKISGSSRGGDGKYKPT